MQRRCGNVGNVEAVERSPDEASPVRAAEVRGLQRGDALPLDGTPTLWRRMPDTPEHLIHPSLAERAAQLSGVRVAFTTDSPWLSGNIEVEPGALVSLTGAGGPRTAAVDVDGRFRFDDLGGQWRTLELWMPHRAASRLRMLTISSDATTGPPAPAGGRWVCYGSSISQGIHVSAPHLTWPSLASRSMDVDLRLLGFASEAHADPVVAADIRDGAAALISICVGINTHTSGSGSLRTFWSNLSGFVETVRERHRDTPLVLISPIASPSRESTPAFPRIMPGVARRGLARISPERVRAAIGPTLSDLRDVVHDVGERVRSESAGPVTVVDGRDLLGPADTDLLLDGLHPGEHGARLIAERFVAHVTATTSGFRRNDEVHLV